MCQIHGGASNPARCLSGVAKTLKVGTESQQNRDSAFTQARDATQKNLLVFFQARVPYAGQAVPKILSDLLPEDERLLQNLQYWLYA